MNDLLATRASLNNGTFTTAEALEIGCTAQGLTQLVKSGEIIRVAAGVYVVRASTWAQIQPNATP